MKIAAYSLLGLAGVIDTVGSPGFAGRSATVPGWRKFRANFRLRRLNHELAGRCLPGTRGLIAAGQRRSAIRPVSPRPACSHPFHHVPCPNPWPTRLAIRTVAPPPQSRLPVTLRIRSGRIRSCRETGMGSRIAKAVGARSSWLGSRGGVDVITVRRCRPVCWWRPKAFAALAG